MPTLLFIYGMLHPDRAPAEIAAAARRLIPRGPATIRARLYNLGAYPGAVLDSSAAPISGSLFAVPDAETLAALDAYEDFHPADPANSLFLRVETTATTPDGSSHPCWVYVYNREVPR
ncbi:MAG: gamma-glutamylcyclotransferase family protein [Acidobacteriaceae bacterium]|jgi:gamma-glutamylcyclotransferase (GGCT)/AIG2-like uncharacterized protein YtfP